MTDTNPADVLQRYNSKIGKTRDPFARLKLKELRDNLKQAIEQVQALRRQYRLVQSGAESVDQDWADAQLQSVGSSLTESSEKVGEVADLYGELLDVAEDDPTVDIDAYLKQKQQQAIEAQRAELMAQMPNQ